MSDVEGVEGREPKNAGRQGLWGVPSWAWVAGLAIGFVIGSMMFDRLIIGLMFGVSIGTAFAIAFSSSSAQRNRDDAAHEREEQGRP